MTEQTMTPDFALATMHSAASLAEDRGLPIHAENMRLAYAAVAALIARNAELEGDNKALRVAAECYRAISATPMAYGVLKRHGLTAGESPYNFCNRMNDEALARAEGCGNG